MIPKIRDSSNGFHLGSQHFKTPQDSARCLQFSPVSCKRNSWGSHSPEEKSSQFLHIGICRDIPHTSKSNRNGAKLDSTKTVHLSSLVVSNWGMPKKRLNLNQENIDRTCGDINYPPYWDQTRLLHIDNLRWPAYRDDCFGCWAGQYTVDHPHTPVYSKKIQVPFL